MQLARLLLVAVIFSSACQNSNNKDEKTAAAGKTDKPIADNVRVIKKWDLPSELREISGLSYVDDKRLVCVQDEAGKVYVYNIADAKIEREIPFNTPGDYEGLAVVAKDIWVLRADGVLFELKDFNADKPAVQEYATKLTVKQDCEGLCYDAAANRLLLTVKEKDPNSTEYKGIYAFDLATRTMNDQPVYKIDLNDKVFAGKSSKKKNNSIMPSGIAINPMTKELFITDGHQSTLLVTDPNGAIKKLVQLDQSIFPQPEGIIFNSKGDLFISNEGPKQPGNILQVEVNGEVQ